MKVKSLEILDYAESFSFCRNYPGSFLIHESPWYCHLIGWIINKIPKLKKSLLIDFINETNGMFVTKADFINNVTGDSVTIHTDGLILKNLELKRNDNRQ